MPRHSNSVGPFANDKRDHDHSTRWERATIKTSSPARYIEDSSESSSRNRHAKSPARSAPFAGDERISRLRAEIAAGTYLSDDKVDAAVDRLIAAEFTEFYY